MSQSHVNDNINNSNNTISSNDVPNNSTAADQKSEILTWLSELEPSIPHQDIQAHRADGVGDWVLQTQEYQNWVGGIPGKSDGSALFCYGGPGVGKTYISSLVIDTLCEQAVKENAAVGYFYFDFAAKEGQTPAAVLGSVLKQVVRELDEVPEKIVKAFQDREVISSHRITVSEIGEFLKDISSSRCVFICIDALDECQARHRAKILDSLNQILIGCPGIRIYLTGRSHIRTEVEEYLARRLVTTSIIPTEDDIAAFIRAKLRESAMPEAMSEELEVEVDQDIPEMISDRFLLASLKVQAAIQEVTKYGGRRMFSRAPNFNFPDGLVLMGAYGATVERVKAQGGEGARLGMAALMWIAHSERPLKVDEICHALAIRTGSNNLNNDDIPAISTLQRYCLGLIAINKSTSTVRLSHYTLQEYSRTNPDLLDRAHLTMAEICLTYLNFQRIKDLSGGSSPDPRGLPFLEYASLYWGTHLRMEASDLAKTLALQLLLDQFDDHTSAESLWNSISRELTSNPTPNRKPFSALHCISYFGIAEVANTMIEMKRWDVNQRDSAGMTPLIWAARYGHEEVVRLFLRQKHIQPDQKDTNYGRTALSWAAGNGHEGVVGLFLGQRSANPRRIGRQWGKALRVAGQLFGMKYANPDSSSRSGRTPLSWAAENGHEGIVKLLLGRGDVNPNRLDTYGRTPLLWAAKTGHEGVVTLLVEWKNLIPDIPDAGYGQTPLSWAAGNGSEGVVKLLLGRGDVNPNSLDGHGRTPLSWAAQNGREGVAKLLLERTDVNPDTLDAEFGRTPLAWAAGNGREEIVRLLLERKDVNSDGSSESGRTPLWLAAEGGYEGIVKLLLEREDVSPDTPDAEFGRTPLSRAAGNGHEEIVELLLKRRGVVPNSLNKSGRTPLSWAAENGREGVVKLLLGRGDVDSDARDTEFRRTPLSWAAGNGHEGVVWLLLEQGDVNPSSSDKSGRTPFLWAAMNGHEGIVELLLAQKGVKPYTQDAVFHQTPISWAAMNGHEGVVKFLLGQEHAFPDSRNKSGQTALALAAQNGHDRIVELLRARHIR